MKQKEALEKLERYCEKNNMHLTSSSFCQGEYALVIHDKRATGNRIIEGGVPCHRESGYHRPTELLIWLDGYNAGLQKGRIDL